MPQGVGEKEREREREREREKIEKKSPSFSRSFFFSVFRFLVFPFPIFLTFSYPKIDSSNKLPRWSPTTPSPNASLSKGSIREVSTTT